MTLFCLCLKIVILVICSFFDDLISLFVLVFCYYFYLFSGIQDSDYSNPSFLTGIFPMVV